MALDHDHRGGARRFTDISRDEVQRLVGGQDVGAGEVSADLGGVDVPGDGVVALDGEGGVDVGLAVADLPAAVHFSGNAAAADHVLFRVVGGMVDAAKESAAPIRDTIAASAIPAAFACASMDSINSPSVISKIRMPGHASARPEPQGFSGVFTLPAQQRRPSARPTRMQIHSTYLICFESVSTCVAPEGYESGGRRQ